MEDNLRKEAESLLGKKYQQEDLQQKTVEELIHELKVHQIELELQNEELMNAQQQLEKSWKKYHQLFDFAPVAYLMVDFTTTILDINLTAASLLGRERGWLKNVRFDKFIHHDYQDDFYFFFNSIIDEEREKQHESCLYVNGEKVFVRIACNVDTGRLVKEDIQIRITIIDITEKKIAELKHQESEKRFRQFAAMLPQVVCELDGNFNLVYLNHFGKKLFGIDHTEESNLFDFLDDVNKQKMLTSFEAMTKDPVRKDPGLQLTFTGNDSRQITLFTYANFDKEDGKITRVRAIGIDLAERIRMENQLSALNEELNAQKSQLEDFNRALEDKVAREVEKNRVKDHLMSLQARQAAMGEMVGHIAHQWKQPLSALNLVVLDLQDAHEHDELTKDYLNQSVDTAKKMIDHMSQTIDDFRNFFRPLKEKTAFDLRRQTDNALSFVRTTLEMAGIRLTNSIDQGVQVKGYPNEFSQVIMNILNNAKDAILENNWDKGIVEIDSLTDDKNVHLFLRNNGGSIPDDVLPRIFDPYFTTKDSKQGTGIGLYLAKNIIERNMNGTLRVANKDGWVEFEIILPVIKI